MAENPTEIEAAVNESVSQHLHSELAARGLLLARDRFREVEGEVTRLGERLLGQVLEQCYGRGRQNGKMSIEFESEQASARIQGALAFGATVANLLGPLERGLRQPTIEFLCATFNLGIGLIDGLCDEDAGIGVALLELLGGEDLIERAQAPRGRGWLRAQLPVALMHSPAIVFTTDIIEVFFETLHVAYSGDESLLQRRGTGMQLVAALCAERESVTGMRAGGERHRLLQCSRLTSVIPFQIIEALAGGSVPTIESSAGTLLGEATWRIDDLVDLSQDARSGALNGVLLMVMDDTTHYDAEHGAAAALGGLLVSAHIPAAAVEAADYLAAGLRLVRNGRGSGVDDRSAPAFLYFMQRYAGIAPGPG